MTGKLPPGVTKGAFEAALRGFADAVGAGNVITDEAGLAVYRDPYTVYGPDANLASAAVLPGSTEEVQAVVRVAAATGVPVSVVSTGKNLGYGGSAPNLSGSLVLDLKRMNRILDVNPRDHSALVEPGVSYFDLYRHIQEKGYKLWIDVPDPGWGSPIGNSLDHGGGYLQPMYRNHFDSHCGMEVVLPNGEVLRTGMGALPDSQTWQQYKFGFGPWIDGMFSQSNLGVVTKMGFWLMPEPDAYLTGTVTVPNYGDLIPLVDILTFLENSGVSNAMPGLGSPLLGGFMMPPPAPEVTALLQRTGGDISSPDLQKYAQGKNVPYWSCTVKFYGPVKGVQAHWEYAKEKFSAIPGAKFQDGEFYKLPLTPEQFKQVHKPEFGIPSLETFSIGARSAINPNPSAGHIWFSPIIPRTGEAVLEANKVFSKAAKDFGLPVLSFSLPSTYWMRAFIFIFGFPITHDVATNKRNRESFKKLIQIAAEHGWGEYRTAPAFQDAVMDTYSFNNHALRRFHETIKDAVDPNGIISAGRYGIWPKHLRGTKA